MERKTTTMRYFEGIVTGMKKIKINIDDEIRGYEKLIKELKRGNKK